MLKGMRLINWIQLEAIACSNIGMIYQEQGKTWRAIRQLEKGVALARKAKDKAYLALTSYKIALVFCKQDRWDKATPHAKRAGKIFKQMEDNDMVERIKKMLIRIDEHVKK